jgi:hypothetical protein
VRLEPVEPPRPGSDTQLYRAPGVAEVAVLQQVARAPHALRLLVEGATLAEAHERAADALDAIAVLDAASRLATGIEGLEPLAVIDLFCLDARFVEEASARLRSDDVATTLLIGVRAHDGDDDEVDMESYGLRKLGMREILVPAVPRRLAETVATFLNDVARYAAASDRAIAPGDAVAFGWVDVRPIAAEGLEVFPDDASQCAPRFVREALDEPADLPGMLVICEPENDEPGAPLQAGASRAASIVASMVASAQQCGVESGLDVPRAQQTAVVSRRLAEGGPAQLRRLARDEITASGWVAVALDQEALDDPADFEVVSLVTLATWLPRSFSLLALPVGSGLTLGADETLTIHLP